MSRNELLTLSDALSDAHLTGLPEPLSARKDGRKWVKAIVKVRKNDVSCNYAIAENDGCGNPSIIKDYGRIGKIVKVEEIYPIFYLEEEDIPDLKNKNDIIKYLSRFGYSAEDTGNLLSAKDADGEAKDAEKYACDREKVKSLVYKCAIEERLRMLKLKKTE